MTVDEMVKSLPLDEYKPTPGANRCDACSARAYGRAALERKGKYLFLEFCGHHLRKFEPALAADGWLIQSRTDILDKEMDAFNSRTKDSVF